MIAFLNNLAMVMSNIVSMTASVIGLIALFIYHDHATFFSCLFTVILLSVSRCEMRITNIEKAVNELKEGQGS